jgi:hypothetical protein
MIRRETVEGREATVAYLRGNFEPCDPDDAEVAKVIFDDGNVVFAALDPVSEDATRGFEWNEEDHPRDETGKFTDAGGGIDSGSQENYEPSTAADKFTSMGGAALHPDVVGVGGDEWNRETAVRLEREYQKAAPDLEKIVQATANTDVEVAGEEKDPDDAPYVPDSWDSLSGDAQSEAEEAYKKQTYDGFYEGEIENWAENDGPNEARAKVAEDFTDGSETDWADEAIKGWLADANADEKRIPYTADQIRDALMVTHDKDKGWGYGYGAEKYTEIEIDEDALLKLKADDPTLPGIEPPTDALTEKDRDALVDELTKAFSDEADKVQDKLEPPDYLGDSIAEYQEESWSSMDDSDKFSWIEHNTSIISDLQEEYDKWATDDEGNVINFDVPDKFDPLQKTGGSQYAATQALARVLSDRRALDLINERGLKFGPKPTDDVELSDVQKADRDLWTGWKGSSASDRGWLLQVATADELGARFSSAHLETYGNYDKERAVKFANAEYSSIGGYEGVKAYIRAKWETTQYLLEKSGTNTVHLYRGLDMSRNDTLREKLATARKTAEVVNINGSDYRKLPALELERNGAASTSIDAKVSNNWDGSDSRVVVRVDAPRTAVLSVPAYGINVQKEREVVVAGSAWNAWDAWDGRAPDFDSQPIKKAA